MQLPSACSSMPWAKFLLVQPSGPACPQCSFSGLHVRHVSTGFSAWMLALDYLHDLLFACMWHHAVMHDAANDSRLTRSAYQASTSLLQTCDQQDLTQHGDRYAALSVLSQSPEYSFVSTATGSMQLLTAVKHTHALAYQLRCEPFLLAPGAGI